MKNTEAKAHCLPGGKVWPIYLQEHIVVLPGVVVDVSIWGVVVDVCIWGVVVDVPM